MDRISPPWDPATVEALNAYQAEAPMHPFTCPNRDAGHREPAVLAAIGHGRDRGVLVATPSGWICRDCDYRQDWAWPWMADTSWWSNPPHVGWYPNTPEARSLLAEEDEQ